MKFQIIAEFRPTIGSCQFYVIFKEPVDVSHVNVDSNKINIMRKNEEKLLSINVTNLRITSNSISGLFIQDCRYIQFRVTIEPDKVFGNFKNEVILNKVCHKQNSSNYEPAMEPGKEIEISCRKCSNFFIKKSFKRVLPLPTSFDIGDFFCHANHSCNEIEVKSEDCLYGLFFIKLRILSDSSCKVIHCKHCSAWIGVREKCSSLLWNSSIKFEDTDQNISKIGLQDFVSSVKYIINKELVTKVVMHQQVSDTEIHYLLLWIIEKNLSLYNNSDCDTSEISLNEQKVFKVLYKYETETSDNVKKWDNDPISMCLQISEQMMVEGLTHLKEMSERIPERFRVANQMNVSYIIM